MLIYFYLYNICLSVTVFHHNMSLSKGKKKLCLKFFLSCLTWNDVKFR